MIFSSFSLGCMACTRADARLAGVSVTSHTLFDFRGPFTQSGSAALDNFMTDKPTLTRRNFESNFMTIRFKEYGVYRETKQYYR